VSSIERSQGNAASQTRGQPPSTANRCPYNAAGPLHLRRNGHLFKLAARPYPTLHHPRGLGHLPSSSRMATNVQGCLQHPGPEAEGAHQARRCPATLSTQECQVPAAKGEIIRQGDEFVGPLGGRFRKSHQSHERERACLRPTSPRVNLFCKVHCHVCWGPNGRIRQSQKCACNPASAHVSPPLHPNNFIVFF